MQLRRSIGMWIVAGVLMLIGAVLAGLVWLYPNALGLQAGSAQQTISLWVVGVTTLVLMALLGAYYSLGNHLGRSAYSRQEAQQADDLPRPAQAGREGVGDASLKERTHSIRRHLREHYGPLWRQKVRLLLLIGDPDTVNAIAPNLTTRHWLEGQGTVLLWGGNAHESLEQTFTAHWSGLSRWRSLDGVIWALDNTQAADAAAMATGVRQLKRLAHHVGWQLPLYLWQVCASTWEQTGRAVQPVGCVLPERFSAQELQEQLTELLTPLRRTGLGQMNETLAHDFLLRLSRDLQVKVIARWRQVLEPLAPDFARGVPLRGLWFSLPMAPVTSASKTHDWSAPTPWQGVLDDNRTARRLGWGVVRVGYALVLGLALMWGAGLLLSFVTNRVQIGEVERSVAALQQPGSGDAQLTALNDLTRELARLDYRAKNGVPWYQRFGLEQNQNLLAAMWPHYVQANNRLMRDPVVANLQGRLKAFIALPPGSEQRAAQAPGAYENLKAYLMLARPQKADATFLRKALGNAEPTRNGVTNGLWQGLSPGLWGFYGEQLAAHPAWAIKADPALVAQARQVLLSQLGQRNAQATLYRKVLDVAANQYPALSLHSMVGETDASALFATTASVPGVFTRQAWEGQVRQAIDEIAEARREEIDWVLSDSQTDIASELTPQMLKEQLTERYFQDYASAWLDFLNSLRWRKAEGMGDVIDQLTLMTDVRQSPLIALMNTLAYQGQAGTRTQALADSLMKSAKDLLDQDKVPLIDQQSQGPRSPLDGTFGPLLTLLGKDTEGQADSERLSLQAFLTRVTRVRLKLQQVSSASDPREMTQALAQTVFQGKSVDLTDTQSYGSLIAASLGAEWGVVGQTLFVQPLAQAWQRVLQPSAAGLNNQWRRAIVTDWQGAFAGRYPFANTTSDASLPMLGQMIRADSGRIEQFLQNQLGGVLRKEGSRWVADPRHSQGLRFNPQFLAAINQLSQLADVMYTDGGMGMSFELQGRPSRNVVQTNFILNGEEHQYFNQRQAWQRFNWPGFSDDPGASLSWTSVQSGERLFGDFEGTWGLIRLLEKATLTPLDDGDSRFRMVLKAPDGLDLTWNLRTEMSTGPLALLALRNFTLPQQIFLSESTTATAHNGGLE
ncbi:type VI secretion protein VasK [Pseudomonas sp. GL93]|uniref:ImcF-related family protein n=1 Tax=Pseudomonas sp. GL93 TaxID=2014741 RepID=UPI000E322F64|nr:ImcF-related family protein [Pseudomonas sp. GL93]RFD25969.1 type VI secretion protein VasK [Pseudomonas sp. GL93]